MRSTGNAATVVAAFGLPGSRAAAQTDVVADVEWPALLRLAEHQRLTGFLVALLASGQVDLGSEAALAIDQSHEAAMTRVLRIERELLHLADLFERSGIRYRVLKGTTFARLHYSDRSLRPFGDLDLLVAGDDLALALELLATEGGERRIAEPRPGFLRRFGKGASVVLPDGTDVDVHRLLALGPFGILLDPVRLFERKTLVALGGRLVPALALEERCLHACYHAVLGYAVPRLMALRDVAQILTRSPVDLAQLRDLASSARAEVVVARAVSLAWDTFGLSNDLEAAVWADSYQPDPESRKMLDLYEGRHRSSAGLTLGSWRVIPGWRDRIAYGAAVFVPRRRDRSEPLVTRWGRGIRSLSSRRRPG